MNPCVQYFYFPEPAYFSSARPQHRVSVAIETPSKQAVLEAIRPFSDMSIAAFGATAFCSPRDRFSKEVARTILNGRLVSVSLKPTSVLYCGDSVLVNCNIQGLEGAAGLQLRLQQNSERVYFVRAY